MFTKPRRILLRDNVFGYALKVIVDGKIPLYLIVTIHGSQRIVAESDFVITDWDGQERHQSQRRKGERRRITRELDGGTLEQRTAERRQGERRKFVVRTG